MSFHLFKTNVEGIFSVGRSDSKLLKTQIPYDFYYYNYESFFSFIMYLTVVSDLAGDSLTLAGAMAETESTNKYIIMKKKHW